MPAVVALTFILLWKHIKLFANNNSQFGKTGNESRYNCVIIKALLVIAGIFINVLPGE